MTHQIPLTIIPNDDGSFTVLSNVFNIVTEGNTLDEAILNGTEALQCHIEGMEKTDMEFQWFQNLDRSLNTFVTVSA